MRSATATCQAHIRCIQSDPHGEVGGHTQETLALTFGDLFFNGTGSGQINRVYRQQLTTTTTPQTIALDALVDPFGDTPSWTSLRALYVDCADADVLIYFDDSGGWTAPLVQTSSGKGGFWLTAGGWTLWTAPAGVSLDNSPVLTIEAVSGTGSANLYLMGAG